MMVETRIPMMVEAGRLSSMGGSETPLEDVGEDVGEDAGDDAVGPVGVTNWNQYGCDMR